MARNVSSLQGLSRSLTAALRRGVSQGLASAPVRAGGAAMAEASCRQSSNAVSGGHPVLQAWRQQAKLSGPVCSSFAASPVMAAMPVSAIAGQTAVQVRSATSTSITEEGDDEATSSTSGPKPRHRRSALSPEGEDNDDDPLPVQSFARGRMRQKQTTWDPGAAAARLHQKDMGEGTSPLEFKLLAEELFMKKPAEAISIPPNIREVLYRFNWDKVLVDVRSTTNSTERGKRQVFTAMVAVGNLNGLFGLGLADAPFAVDAVGKAYMDAFSKLTFVPLYRGHTIHHRIDHEYHHMKMRLMPRHDGWGVKASNLVSELCGLVGIKNISIKMFGRVANKFYVAQCFQEALSLQSTPQDGVEGSGVYVREVYNLHDGRLPMGLQRGVDVL